MKNKYPLDSLEKIRTALRKNTVQTAIYEKQAAAGSDQTNELLAYIGFMNEDECMAFLNSVREAPFIPNVNLMWTEQITEYLMVDEMQLTRKNWRCGSYSNVRKYIESCCKGEEFSYTTGYIQRHIDKAYWNMLPRGWSAKYYRPSQVLKMAILFASDSDFCKHIAEKLFIKAADLEDCLSPVTKIPPALPALPK